MTQHSIEELKRQYEQAMQKKCEADKRAFEAGCAYRNGVLEQYGLKEKIAITAKHPNGVFVTDCSLMGGKPWRLDGLAVKKDGSIGEAHRSIYGLECVLEIREPRP